MPVVQPVSIKAPTAKRVTLSIKSLAAFAPFSLEISSRILPLKADIELPSTGPVNI